jgi:hypothetical protein
MKLWLDDVRDPKKPQIQEQFGAEGDELWVKTSYEAINYLKRPDVISISLDYDLDPGAGTGLEVAQWIAEQAIQGNLKRIIWSLHSSSREGRWAMARYLKQAEEAWANFERINNENVSSSS